MRVFSLSKFNFQKMDLDKKNQLNSSINESSVSENKKFYPKKAKPLTQQEKLKRNIQDYCKNVLSIEWSDEIENDLPKKYKLSQDLLILPSNCFQSEYWTRSNRNDFYKLIADSFKVNRVAQENRVKPDDYRSPNLILLYGSDPIVNVVNNGIK
jgi:hypothetical protein